MGKKLTNRLGLALERGEIEVEDLSQVVDMILSVFETMTYQENMVSFLQKLSGAWPFFNEVIDEHHQITYFGSANHPGS